MTTKWLKLEQYRKVQRFVGPKIAWYMSIGILVGIVLFSSEIAFAFGLQAFLVQLGVMNVQTIELPRWMPQSSLAAVMGFIMAVGTARAIMQWSQIYMQSATLQHLQVHLKKRVLRWAFSSESASSSRVSDIFGSKTGRAASAVGGIQALSILLTTSSFLCFALLKIAPVLAVVSVLILGAMSFPLKFVDKRIKKTGENLAEHLSLTNRRMMLNIRNLLLMQIYGTERQEEKLAFEGLDLELQSTLSYSWLAGFKFAFPQIVGLILLCLVMMAAKSMASVSSSILIVFFYLFIRLIQALSAINLNVSQLMMDWPQLMMMSNWWAEHSFDGVHNPQDYSSDFERVVAFDSPIGWKAADVSFRYSGSSLDVIRNLSFEIKPGEALVLTGPSGAGKSTMLNLLLGTVDPTSGIIEILTPDGNYHPVRDYKLKLRKTLGFVGPENFLIEDSVYRNIIYGLKDEPDKFALELAIEQAECQFIWSLPNKLEHRLTDQGQGLSAGQKQRLSLARALLRRPKVLILDEPTANLDEETELKLVETLMGLKKHMTIIAVSHRPALLRIADRRLHLAES